MGVGQVAASFAWTEPTATLTIEPYVPEPEPEPEPVVPTYDVALEAGLNMISVPLMPTEPYTAKSLAELVGATVVIKLDPETQSFVGYVAIDEDDGFGIEGGQGYIVNTPEGGPVTFSGYAWSNESQETEEEAAAPTLSILKNAWAFIVSSELKDIQPGMSYTVVAKNLRTGTVATEKVTGEDGSVSAVWADLNRKSVVEAGDKIEISLLDQEGTTVSGPFQRTVQTSDIHNAYLTVQLRVGDVRPQETILGQNFPNPFNPETWIPYQLSKDSNVSITIFDVSGHTVRSLNLGHQSVGSYMQPSSAAYWDGKNDAGESVSSGIYFYTLQTDNISSTRRMVILK
ncbi:T9SS type A sorting domain-containing protein [Candidatus Poribacteria bacterium]|nr:T9SS type A sorting domain-containing protein [Candidatus Poribacteria bacterium]